MECLKQILDSASKGNFIKAFWNRQSVYIEFAVRFKKMQCILGFLLFLRHWSFKSKYSQRLLTKRCKFLKMNKFYIIYDFMTTQTMQ